MSSVYSAKTGLSSILKAYSPAERERAKNIAINKVRFEIPKQKGILDAVEAVNEHNNFQPLNEFVAFLKETELSDNEFSQIMSDAHKLIYDLSPKFTNLVEALISLPWTKRQPTALQAYTEFYIDIMVAHNKYVEFGIPKLISLWIPTDGDEAMWPNGTPIDNVKIELEAIHHLLDRILTAIPMSFEVVLETIENKFPYFKKATHVIAGYVHNVLWLTEYKPIFTEFVMQLLMQKLVVLDVNAPRSEIEETECEEDEDLEEENEDQEIFEMDDCQKSSSANQKDDDMLPMKHAIGHTLDICMEKMFNFLDTRNPYALNATAEQRMQLNKFWKVLLTAFDNVILPSHNTHHVQFLLFYHSSFKNTIAEAFLQSLWDKIKNPNVSAVIRQAAVGYIASFLARAKFLPLHILKYYLKELCDWAHQYIQRCDQYRQNGSLKANIVFFSLCQAVFYVIAFRSRDLTADRKSLLFLQSLQLSAIVTCNFNPLRVCLPAVATAFAGVTRAYQLAYCHAILERNARRKLATVYANDTATPEETLDTFFPFDPYLLKMSEKKITPHYLQYQASEAEEASVVATHMSPLRQRKRGDSEMCDDIDDFIVADKRQKIMELARSQEREAQFTYGLSPGFHM
ncbi:RNA polymerase I-specific transcription initiation factor RRN3 [Bactrocera tryoni]|uniref:RNA polymerase I-specific transcription initiation factor RRN3 n=1 Tax=Bactrocera tryoni TaxID=59916 RepID=UPI001A9675ED|nr:RNA polymerase I-specific transcription initiation factor RRN3 [Bactrocera tryoni]